MEARKICFVSHNATRTGAPIVLLHFLKWLKSNKGIRADVLFLEEGELVDEFKKVSNVFAIKQSKKSSIFLIKKFIKKIFQKDIELSAHLKRLSNYDEVIFNTASSFRILHLIEKKGNTKFIAWIHEQSYSIETWYKDFFTVENLSKFDRIVVVSEYIREYIIRTKGISSGLIKVVYPFIDTKEMENKLLNSSERIKKEFIVGACGMQLWLKGPDLFLKVAQYVSQRQPEIALKFRWIGGEGEMTTAIKYEIEKLNLSGLVEFTGAKENAALFFSEFDLFLLTSREDSFPLVVLEACSNKLPVICFDQIGAIVKLVSIIPENVVSYSDVEAMAERIVHYYRNPVQAQNDGEAYFSEIEKYDKEVLAPVLYDALFY